jgi:hypothetical protein
VSTRRERLEAKLDKRAEWSDKAKERSAARFDSAHKLADRIPLGQPILVGHHSERRARSDAAKIHGNMSKGVEEHKLAEHHESKARGLAIALDRTIYDDDVDAIERLEERIAQRESDAARCTAVNKAWRKGGIEAVRALHGDKFAEVCASTMKMAPWLKSPLSTTGTRAAIRTDRERIETIKTKRARAEQAEAAPEGLLVESLPNSDYVRVTFPEKPARDVLEALRGAGFAWRSGSWVGKREALPSCVASTRVDADETPTILGVS